MAATTRGDPGATGNLDAFLTTVLAVDLDITV